MNFVKQPRCSSFTVEKNISLECEYKTWLLFMLPIDHHFGNRCNHLFRGLHKSLARNNIGISLTVTRVSQAIMARKLLFEVFQSSVVPIAPVCVFILSLEKPELDLRFDLENQDKRYKRK